MSNFTITFTFLYNVLLANAVVLQLFIVTITSSSLWWECECVNVCMLARNQHSHCLRLSLYVHGFEAGKCNWSHRFVPNVIPNIFCFCHFHVVKPYWMQCDGQTTHRNWYSYPVDFHTLYSHFICVCLGVMLISLSFRELSRCTVLSLFFKYKSKVVDQNKNQNFRKNSFLKR